MPTMTSRRPRPSRGVLAWIVVSEPSWPVFMGLQHVERFFRSDLANDDAVGPHTEGVDDELPDVDGAPCPPRWPGAFPCAPRGSAAAAIQAASSMVTMRSSSGNVRRRERSACVVLPEPVPPQIRMLMPRLHAPPSADRACLRSRAPSWPPGPLP